MTQFHWRELPGMNQYWNFWSSIQEPSHIFPCIFWSLRCCRRRNHRFAAFLFSSSWRNQVSYQAQDTDRIFGNTGTGRTSCDQLSPHLVDNICELVQHIRWWRTQILSSWTALTDLSNDSRLKYRIYHFPALRNFSKYYFQDTRITRTKHEKGLDSSISNFASSTAKLKISQRIYYEWL